MGVGVSQVGSCSDPAVPLAVRLQVLVLCGAAYRPTEEIDLRSVGWGNIFQLPFKHVRDFRLRHLVPFFVYSGFEVLFACTGIALVSRGKSSFWRSGNLGDRSGASLVG